MEISSAGPVRQAAVAGAFYPDDRELLQKAVKQHLDAAAQQPAPIVKGLPKALIVPHAGYIYSGATAASAYLTLRPLTNKIRKVLLLGPAHRVWFQGLASSTARYFRTPLGDISIDTETIKLLSALPQVHLMDEAHRQEHSLEVQLPFLQSVLSKFSLVPLVIGNADTDQVVQVLERCWGGAETLLVISSDLSHFHNYAEARAIDHHTCQQIEQQAADQIGSQQACGSVGINAMLAIAKQRQLSVHTLALCNSGDTAGDRQRVVGYGSWAFTESSQDCRTTHHV